MSPSALTEREQFSAIVFIALVHATKANASVRVLNSAIAGSAWWISNTPALPPCATLQALAVLHALQRCSRALISPGTRWSILGQSSVPILSDTQFSLQCPGALPLASWVLCRPARAMSRCLSRLALSRLPPAFAAPSVDTQYALAVVDALIKLRAVSCVWNGFPDSFLPALSRATPSSPSPVSGFTMYPINS
ncbi:hypothetical protein B0H16DRAFT_1804897 [Mycena metata]|uniref:Uncharacterized protein n=1 Tax=Mycena metata TaxID=1033252 RepID=A0AAD7H9Q3_9AGAR|nr:hypothetical protein B0H16DRAFT_1804897 [Mycena metata]